MLNSLLVDMLGMTPLIKVGPYGESSLTDTSTWDERGHTKITVIYISYSDNYGPGVSLQFEYDEGGNTVLSQSYGHHDRPKFSVVHPFF